MNLRNLTPGLAMVNEVVERERLAKGHLRDLHLRPKRRLTIPERDEQIEILNWRN